MSKSPATHHILQRFPRKTTSNHVVYMKTHALGHWFVERLGELAGTQTRRMLADESGLVGMIECSHRVGEHLAPRAHSLPTCLASCSAWYSRVSASTTGSRFPASTSCN